MEKMSKVTSEAGWKALEPLGNFSKDDAVLPRPRF